MEPTTVSSIHEATKGSDWWLRPESAAARTVAYAVTSGYLRRHSHTQVEWTEAGLAKARRNLG